ncbi:MAG: hypothetical protein M5R36_25605 [Deltaproteobacteria bacterium]|nr:hypothetical protein [Deltaproteobacteria bacterium]
MGVSFLWQPAEAWMINNVIAATAPDSAGPTILSGLQNRLTLFGNDLYGPSGFHLLWDGAQNIDDPSAINACQWNGCVDASDNISARPDFTAPDDFHLSADSACVDAGVDPSPWDLEGRSDFDLDGDARPFGAAPDIGADEWRP